MESLASQPPLDLLDLLSVEQTGPTSFLATESVEGPLGIYGGQVVGQALMAAAGTVGSDLVAHSLHGYFLRRGDPAAPVSYEVELDRDGRSYSARRVTAQQAGRLIFTMSASFHVAEDGPDRQAIAFPDTPGPDESKPFATHLLGIEVRNPRPDSTLSHPTRVWMRCDVPPEADGNIKAAVLAYASDLFTGMSSMVELGEGDMFTSLDHAVWLHRPFRMEEWVLMDLVGVSMASNRGWYTGHFYDPSGVVLAGMTQEMVLRLNGPH
jgi:acyl-CoA thioesterase-2